MNKNCSETNVLVGVNQLQMTSTLNNPLLSHSMKIPFNQKFFNLDEKHCLTNLLVVITLFATIGLGSPVNRQ